MSTSIEANIGHRFSNKALLEAALTHVSVQDSKGDYERLEFLGDRVLGLAVAETIFNRFPDENEGLLARRHAALVQQQTLALVAETIGLPGHLRLSAGEAKSGGQEKEAILADVVEALIGAVFKDSGYLSAAGMVARLWDDLIDQQVDAPEDAKTKLQEWAQARGLPLPQYKVVAQTGDDHAPSFDMEVSIIGHGSTRAEGANKREASKAAARKFLDTLGEGDT